MPEDVEVVIEKEEEKEVEVSEKKDPLKEQDKLTPDHPKFQEIYKNWKVTEKALEDIRGRLLEKDSVVGEMQKHNAALVKAIERSADVTREAISGKAEDKEFSDAEHELNEQLISLRGKKAAALKGFDYDIAAELDEKIIDVKLAQKELATIKIEKKENKDNGRKDTEADDNTAFAEFAESTSWYMGEKADPIMIASAHALDKMLLGDKKWSSKPAVERLAEVKKQIETRFDWKGEGEKASKKKFGNTEAPDNMKQGSPKTIKLTALEVKAAREMGVSEEDWARQKMLIAKERGE